MHSTDFHHQLSEKLMPEYKNEHVASQHAWWILESITGKNRALLLAEDELQLSEDQKKQLASWEEKILIEHMPLQYLIGFVPFDGVTIFVEPPTLIPRPETEEWCVDLIKQLQKVPAKKTKILDIATGSGCIAIALAHNLKDATVDATDIARDALELAERNATLNGVSNINFLFSDLFSNVTDTYDLIVSNPPYIAEGEFKYLEKSVTKWEDKHALVADEDGLALIKNIIINAPKFIRKNDVLKKAKIPQLVIEIGSNQGHEVKTLFRKAGYNDIEVHTDLAGRVRYVTGRVDGITVE